MNFILLNYTLIIILINFILLNYALIIMLINVILISYILINYKLLLNWAGCNSPPIQHELRE